MIPVAAKAAAAIPHHLSSAAPAAPVMRKCVCGLQAVRAKATMEETCVCLESAVGQPAPSQLAGPAASEWRPAFHLAPAGGWINDPNGPLLHNGTYHLFYQHVPDSSEWQWGLVWGHAKSKDLVNWQHLPVALEPTPNGLDQHGCFSGCATVDVDGRPTLLYTGVIRKAAHEIEPDVSPQHESQLIAVATDLDDPDLTHWQKLPGIFLPHPPADMDLTGWRDPFVLEKPTAGSPWWYVMIGAGVRNKCGTAMVYRSKDLTEGWQYCGPLCESSNSYMWECPIMAHLRNAAPDRRIQESAQQQQDLLKRHMLAVSPDYCVNMIQYWLGDYSKGKFDLDSAAGPFLLDLGDIMYAPNVLTDQQGRTVLWAWMQEKQHLRPPCAYSSACCLCAPRVLFLSPDGMQLMQEPLPELRELRKVQSAWHAGAAAAAVKGSTSLSTTAVALPPRQVLPVGHEGAAFNSSSVDVELKIAKGGSDLVAVLLQPFEGAGGAAGAAISYCWSTNTLQVIYSTDLAAVERVAVLPVEPRMQYRQPGPDPIQLAAAEAAAAEPGTPMRCGGVLRAAGADAPSDVISLRVLLDGSCLEVFTSTGEALGTRVYHGDQVAAQPQHMPPPQQSTEATLGLRDTTAAAMAAAAAAGAVGWEQLFAEGPAAGSPSAGGQLELVSFGPGPALLLSSSAWEMASMWQEQQQQAEAVPAFTAAPTSTVLPVPAAAAVTAAATEVLQGLVVAEAAVVAAAAAAATVAPVMLPVGEMSLDLTAVGDAEDRPPHSPSEAGGAVQVMA